jgi:hypothetical protein
MCRQTFEQLNPSFPLLSVIGLAIIIVFPARKIKSNERASHCLNTQKKFCVYNVR